LLPAGPAADRIGNYHRPLAWWLIGAGFQAQFAISVAKFKRCEAYEGIYFQRLLRFLTAKIASRFRFQNLDMEILATLEVCERGPD